MLYMTPPKKANTEKIWLQKKCSYGLSDVVHHWYLKVVGELKTLDATQLSLDQAVFIWHNSNGNSFGIMAVPVDNLIYGGIPTILNTVISQLRCKFKICLEESEGMKYLGIYIKQNSCGISLSTDAYCSNLKEIHDIGIAKNWTLNDQETKQLLCLSGQLNWIVTLPQPYDNCIVDNSISKAAPQTMIQSNKAVRKARTHEVSLNYPSHFNRLH